MRITGRDLRKVINEEVRRSMGLREIRVNSDEEPAAQDDENSDEYEPYEEDEDEEDAKKPVAAEEDNERANMFNSLKRDINTLMSSELALRNQLPAVFVGLEDIFKNGQSSRWSKAVMKTLKKANENRTFGGFLMSAANPIFDKYEDKIAITVIAALSSGRIAGIEKGDENYWGNTLGFDFDWWLDTDFEDTYQDVKFLVPLIKFINSK